MGDSKPLVSIGMPAHEGERFLREALDSLLAQDYENFELIISDNASTDRTGEISKEYCARDKRIRYFRNERNLGAVKNFNNLIQMSTGRYFVWAADHDLWHPSFISRCVSVLENNPTVVVVYPRTMLIDSNGNELGITPDRIDTQNILSAVHRYIHVIFTLEWGNIVYGVMRKRVLRQTGGFRNVLGGDMVLMAELALLGTFAQINEPLFYRRQNRPDEDFQTQTNRILSDFDPMNVGKKTRKSAQNLYRERRNAHLKILARAPMDFRDKLYAFIKTLECYRGRFGMETSSLLLAEKIDRHFIPTKLHLRIASWLRGL